MEASRRENTNFSPPMVVRYMLQAKFVTDFMRTLHHENWAYRTAGALWCMFYRCLRSYCRPTQQCSIALWRVMIWRCRLFWNIEFIGATCLVFVFINMRSIFNCSGGGSQRCLFSVFYAWKLYTRAYSSSNTIGLSENTKMSWGSPSTDVSVVRGSMWI